LHPPLHFSERVPSQLATRNLARRYRIN
jgi:hypothetical protein